MKLCIATGIYPPSIGGPATYSKLLFDELPQRGIPVAVLSYDSVRHLPKGLSHLVYFFKLLATARDCDVIYAQDPVSVGLPALCAARLLRKKFFIRVAGDYAWEQSTQRFGVADGIDDFQKKSYEKKPALLKKIQSFVVSHADKVVTPSKYFKELVAGWGVAAEKITHIYNGVEMEPDVPERAAARHMLNIPSDATVLISSGRLVPWKGFVELIEAFSVLRLQHEHLLLYILGDGEQEATLRALIAEKGLEAHVIMPGKVARETMFAYLAASDMFVLNTSFESFSFQLVEAMQMGLPIVSTNIGNIPEIIESGVHGFLLAPNDVAQMTAVIGELIAKPELRAEMGARAKEQSKLFSKERLIENVIELLR